MLHILRRTLFLKFTAAGSGGVAIGGNSSTAGGSAKGNARSVFHAFWTCEKTTNVNKGRNGRNRQKRKKWSKDVLLSDGRFRKRAKRAKMFLLTRCRKLVLKFVHIVHFLTAIPDVGVRRRMLRYAEIYCV